MYSLRYSILRLWPLLLGLILSDQVRSANTDRIALLGLFSAVIASSLMYFLLTQDRELSKKQRAEEKRRFRYT